MSDVGSGMGGLGDLDELDVEEVFTEGAARDRGDPSSSSVPSVQVLNKVRCVTREF